MGKIQRSNALRLLSKEMMVSLVNGFFWAIVVSFFAVLIFQTSWEIGLIVGISMLLNIFASAIAGVTIPFVLKRIGIDPALGKWGNDDYAYGCIGFRHFSWACNPIPALTN